MAIVFYYIVSTDEQGMELYDSGSGRRCNSVLAWFYTNEASLQHRCDSIACSQPLTKVSSLNIGLHALILQLVYLANILYNRSSSIMALLGIYRRSARGLGFYRPWP